jgi:hypothetical protein
LDPFLGIVAGSRARLFFALVWCSAACMLYVDGSCSREEPFTFAIIDEWITLKSSAGADHFLDHGV